MDQAFLLIFIFIDIGEYDATVYGYLDITVSVRLFRNQNGIFLNFVHYPMKIISGLMKRILSFFHLAGNGKSKILRISGDNLIQPPIFNFKDDKPNIFGIEKKVRFAAINVRQVPAKIFLVGFGNCVKKAIETFLTFCSKHLYVSGDHCSHSSPVFYN
ncbi:MAG: hypothetical protein BWY38_03048 [Ignavibacteria bacterium ADurb.Bin266]|nr:MAG: hypothetical protein BWY38_03048 [Ignavibacteria bacterium ADurb.Bin266]